MSLFHLYRTPALSSAKKAPLLLKARQSVSPHLQDIETEYCFNINAAEPLTPDETKLLTWLLAETFEPSQFGQDTFLKADGSALEVGPRMNFTTAWSTNAVSVCHACGLTKIRRIERSRRYLLKGVGALGEEQKSTFLGEVHDRMTECPYPEPLCTFETGIEPESVFEIPVMEEGRAALEKINQEMGLAFDDWDLDYYTNLFLRDIGRNPTNVECFDVAQSNSEHSRHWFFKGRLVVDGQEAPDHLIALIRQTL